MRVLRILASICPLILGAPLGHAQIQQAGSFHPASLGPVGDYRAIVAGDLDWNLSPEVAVIKGTTLIVFQNPDVWADWTEVAEDVLDVCYWPNAGGVGVPGLVYTTAGGLGIATFQSDALDAWYECDVVSYASYPLQGAKLVRYVPSDLGVEKLFLVGSDGRTVYSAVVDAGQIGQPVQLFTINPTIWDIVLLDYAESGTDVGIDVGILHQNGINVRGQGNTVYLARSAHVPGDAISRVRAPTGSSLGDSLAWVTRVGGGLSNLYLFNPAFHTPQHPFPYLSHPLTADPSIVYASATGADANADGIEDVVLGRETSWIEVQLLGDPTLGPIFGDRLALDMSSVSEEEMPMGRILCTDLYNDRDEADVPIPSFAAMLTELDTLRLLPGLDARGPGSPFQTLSLAPDFAGVSYRSALHEADVDCIVPTELPTTQQRALWTIDIGTGWSEQIVTTHGGNYLELIVRRCPGESTTRTRAALAHWIFPIDGTIENTDVSFLPHATENQDSWLEALPSRQFAMVRPIRLTNPPAFNSMDRAWRWSIVGMSASCSGSDWLIGRHGAGTPIPIDMTDSVCEPILCEAEAQALNRLPPQAVPQSDIPPSEFFILPIVLPPNYNN